MLENLLSGITLQSETIPNWLVIAMGIGTVFVGLICIIIICKIMSLFFVKRSKSDTVVPATPVAAPAKETVIENRQEIIAAVAAVAAEELGTDISAIRIHSFKKI
jgi:Na+-transporting methylmalonyl-CoA/oxaloacetate decarboxylase gamma subunit